MESIVILAQLLFTLTGSCAFIMYIIKNVKGNDE